MPFSWGDLDWGDMGWSGGDISATRLLNFVRMGPNFRALADIIDARSATIAGVLETIKALFDLDSATAHQLDLIGQWLGFDRQGLSDTRYRRALRVQVSSLLSSQGTAATLIQIWQDWTGNPASNYRNFDAEVEIGGKVSAADELLLGRFLRDAAPGGVRIYALGYDPADVLRADYDPGDEIGGLGLVDYTPGDTLDNAKLARTV